MLDDNPGRVFELLALVDSDGVKGVEAVVKGGVNDGGRHDGEELFAKFSEGGFGKTFQVVLDDFDEFGFVGRRGADHC
jgi:hypothetical protein